jgi:hypothetical protein
MKLKCVKHDRRVMILDNGEQWVHRTGDLSDCDSLNAKIGEEEIGRDTNTFGYGYGHESAKMSVKIDPAQRLLYDIFANGVSAKPKLHETETPVYIQKGDLVPIGYTVLTEDFEFTAIYDTNGTVNVYVDWGDDQPGDMSNHSNMAEARGWLNTLLKASTES